MNYYKQTKTLPYSKVQLYSLVCDINNYPLFLPWCIKAELIEHHENYLIADLTIGYQIMQETFRSKVDLRPHDEIIINCLSGPFSKFEGIWRFKDLCPHPPQCETEFMISFSFKQSWLNLAMRIAASEANKKIMSAFEQRAYQVFRERALCAPSP